MKVWALSPNVLTARGVPVIYRCGAMEAGLPGMLCVSRVWELSPGWCGAALGGTAFRGTGSHNPVVCQLDTVAVRLTHMRARGCGDPRQTHTSGGVSSGNRSSTSYKGRTWLP